PSQRIDEVFKIPDQYVPKFEQYMFLRDNAGTTNLHHATSHFGYFAKSTRHFKIQPVNYTAMQNKYGHTLLMFSVFNRTTRVTDLLLNSLKANPAQLDSENRNLYHYLAEIHQQTYLERFIE
ncbi:hypothetical protein, partial [Salmonella sp. s51228]|uniref:hypothetical protein n=1 Tax=Salmonella sp. s51228 TaxID=3159652 RepID=UPI00397F4EE4